jgi:DNA replication protein DnaC
VIVTAPELRGLAVGSADVTACGLPSVLAGRGLAWCREHFPSSEYRLLLNYLGRLQAAHQRGIGVMFSGVGGAGKTTALGLIGAAYRAATGGRLSVQYRVTPDVIEHCNAVALPSTRQDATWLAEDRRLRTCGVLLLDELSVLTTSDKGSAHWFAIMDARLTSDLITCVGSNMPLADLRRVAGEISDCTMQRILARLGERTQEVVLSQTQRADLPARWWEVGA